MDKIPSLNSFVEQSIKDNWERDALTDYKGATLQFHDVARKIEKLHILFENSEPQQFQLGRGFPGHTHLRGRGRAHTA